MQSDSCLESSSFPQPRRLSKDGLPVPLSVKRSFSAGTMNGWPVCAGSALQRQGEKWMRYILAAIGPMSNVKDRVFSFFPCAPYLFHSLSHDGSDFFDPNQPLPRP